LFSALDRRGLDELRETAAQILQEDLDEGDAAPASGESAA
jgi:hypothetical protein